MLLLKYSNLLLKKSSHCVDLNLSLVYPQMFYYPLFINLQRKVKRSHIFLRWLFIVTFYHCLTSLVYHQCLLSLCLLSLVYHHLFIVTLLFITCLSSFVYWYFVYHHLFIIICLLLLCVSSFVYHHLFIVTLFIITCLSFYRGWWRVWDRWDGSQRWQICTLPVYTTVLKTQDSRSNVSIFFQMNFEDERKTIVTLYLWNKMAIRTVFHLTLHL